MQQTLLASSAGVCIGVGFAGAAIAIRCGRRLPDANSFRIAQIKPRRQWRRCWWEDGRPFRRYGFCYGDCDWQDRDRGWRRQHREFD